MMWWWDIWMDGWIHNLRVTKHAIKGRVPADKSPISCPLTLCLFESRLLNWVYRYLLEAKLCFVVSAIWTWCKDSQKVKISITLFGLEELKQPKKARDAALQAGLLLSHITCRNLSNLPALFLLLSQPCNYVHFRLAAVRGLCRINIRCGHPCCSVRDSKPGVAQDWRFAL